MGNGRLPKDTAGCGLTSTLWPPNFEEEEPQLEDKGENYLRASQAKRPGRRPARLNLADRAWSTVDKIGISQAVGQASARDSNMSRVGPGAFGPARPGCASLARELAPTAKIVGFEISDFFQIRKYHDRSFFGFLKCHSDFFVLVLLSFCS